MEASDDGKLRRTRGASNGKKPRGSNRLVLQHAGSGNSQASQPAADEAEHAPIDAPLQQDTSLANLVGELYRRDARSDEQLHEESAVRRRTCRRIYERTILALVCPSPPLDRWLREAAHWEPTQDEQTTMLIRAVKDRDRVGFEETRQRLRRIGISFHHDTEERTNYRLRTAAIRQRSGATSRDESETARQLLLRDAQQAFQRLPDERLRKLLNKVSDSPGGAAKRGIYAVCAELALLCGALNAKQRQGETLAAAIRRVSKSFLQAEKRVNRQRTP